jgi:hypothetical protein
MRAINRFQRGTFASGLTLTITQFDDFLDDATHAVCELYEAAGGRKMDTNERYRLNDELERFFRPVTDVGLKSQDGNE